MERSGTVAATADAGIRHGAILAAIACVLCMAFGPAVLFLGTFALFLNPVSSDFGWGAAVYPGGLFLSGIVGALTGPFAGRLMDRYGVRTVLVPAFILWALALAGLSYIEGSSMRLYAVCGLMGVAQGASGPVALAKVLSGWFDRTRGLVLSLVLGTTPAVATVIALIMTRQLIPSQGWGATYQLSALAVLVVALPVVVLWLREAPVANPETIPGAAPGLPGMRLVEALRTRRFWTLSFAAGICCGAAMGVSGHVMAWSIERNMDTGLTTAALSAYSIAGPVGSLISGIVADKTNSAKVLAGFFLLPSAGIALLLVGGEATLVPGLALLGLGFAAAAGLTPYLATRYFGIRYGSEILGVVIGMLQLMVGLGPVLVGLAHDSAGGYTAIMPAAAAVALVAFLLALTLPRYGSAQEAVSSKPAS